MHKLLAAFSLIVAFAGGAWADATRVTVGVLAGDGEHDAPKRWSPTADYLAGKIPEHRFVIVPLDRENMHLAVERDELDFILTSPGQYVDLAASYGSVALATIQRAWRNKTYPVFGSAIITRADRQDIAWLSQLKGKSFMAVSRNDFDGFQLAWWEFKAHGIDPFEDFSGLTFSGLPPDEIVYAVLSGSVDAAAVRVAVLERMAGEGKISMKEFRILHPHVTPEYPFARSTELYPDWPFARARGTPEALARQVADALQTMPADHPAARAGGYAGWTPSLDYQSVHELLRDLRLPPYEAVEQAPLAAVVRQYRNWLIAGGAFVFLLSGFTVYVSWMNRRLGSSKSLLEREIGERIRAEDALRRGDRTLRALHEITSRHSLSFDGKARSLLGLGCEHFRMPVGILSRVEEGRYEVVEILAQDETIARGAVLGLEEALCCGVLQTGDPLGCERVAPVFPHPAFTPGTLGSYFCIRVEVEGEVYGTLNFVSSEPRPASFTDADREILKLMAQWLGGEIGRQRAGARMRQLSSALEQTADAVMIVNRNGLIEYVNPAFEKITGYPRQEVTGRKPGILRSGRHGEEFYRRLWETILRGDPFHDTFINRRRDGVLYYEEKTITPLKDEYGIVTHFVATGKDVTRRKLAEERARQRQAQLAHVQRVSAMGAMATSLAHELNQPLAAIVNYAQGCIHRLRGGEFRPDEFQTVLEHIASEGNRSGEIIRRVREFLRKGKPLRTRADVNQIVREAADLAGLEARQKDVALLLELTDGLSPVLADAVQIEQVVLNLMHNAIEAIDGAHCTRREVTVQTRPDPKNGVEVIVRDTGPGLPVKNSERLFAPFFTTRADGMGMGLSISRSIVEAHGDRLSAGAGADGGAIFHFSLPVVGGGMLQ